MTQSSFRIGKVCTYRSIASNHKQLVDLFRPEEADNLLLVEPTTRATENGASLVVNALHDSWR